MKINKLITVLLPACLAFSTLSLADDGATEKRILAAISSDNRTPDDKQRDSSRKPLQTLMFFGLKEDMKVVEILPGGGWYSKILAPVLAQTGEYYLSIGSARALKMLGAQGLDQVKIAEKDVRFEFAKRGQAQLHSMDLGVSDMDMVLTFRNLHNFTTQSRKVMHQGIYNALRPGGVYGVVDHTLRHMQPKSDETWRRMDPVQAIKEITAVGFEFVGFSNLHYRAGDDLKLDTIKPAINRNSDRFTLKFRKPAD